MKKRMLSLFLMLALCIGLTTPVAFAEMISWQNPSGEHFALMVEDGCLVTYYACGEILIIPDSVTSIGERALARCDTLKNLTIPGSVTTIGRAAFADCPDLNTVTILNGITTIDSEAFSGCVSLTNITIPNSVTSIGEKAFSGCTGLKSITIPDSVTSIGKNAFSGCTGLKSVTIPDSVTTIGDYAFSECNSLTGINIPSSVSTIGQYAFSKCANLTAATFANGSTTTGEYTFSECPKLTGVTIPNGITAIGSGLCYKCTSLADISIPDSVTEIGYYAFDGCTSLASITIPKTVTKISSSAFRNNPQLTIYGYFGSAAESLSSSFPFVYLDETVSPPPSEVDDTPLVYSQIIAPQYEDARWFTDPGLAAVKKDGKWGYIDTENNTVIPFQYDAAFPFSDGYAIVCSLLPEESYQEEAEHYGDTITLWYDCYQYGFIDETGEYTPFTYLDPDTGEEVPVRNVVRRDDGLSSAAFSDGIAPLCWTWNETKGGGLFGTDGKEIPLELNEDLSVDPDDPDSGIWTYYAGKSPISDGTTILTFTNSAGGYMEKYYDFETKTTFLPTIPADRFPNAGDRPVRLDSFSQGLAAVGIYTGDEYCTGFIDKTGNWVIEPQFYAYWSAVADDRQTIFQGDDLILVDKGSWDLCIYGAIDREGNTVLDFKYDDIYFFVYGMAPARCSGKYGYIDPKGELVLLPQYTEAGPFTLTGFAMVSDKDATHDGFSGYLIDRKGNVIPGSENLDLSYYLGNRGQYGFDFGFTAWSSPYLIILDRDEVGSDPGWGQTYDNAKYGFGLVSHGTALTKSMFTVNTNTETYSGSPITKSISGKDGDTDLVLDTDYTVTYENNTNVGTAKIIITGKGNYAGRLEYTFTIKAKSTSTGGSVGSGSVGKKPSTTPPPAETPPEETPPAEATPEEELPAETPPAETPVPVTERFADVREDAWYRDAIQYVSDKGMMVGLEPNAFSPETTSTRGTIVTMLYRLEGEPAVANSRFSDVPGDAWYAKGAAWAAANGIVTGFEDASFRPESPVTREQLAAILYRYAAEKGYDVTDRAELSGFSDAGSISSYALDAMGWAKAAGIITGTDWGSLEPIGTATRAEIAAMLMRFCENVMK